MTLPEYIKALIGRASIRRAIKDNSVKEATVLDTVIRLEEEAISFGTLEPHPDHVALRKAFAAVFLYTIAQIKQNKTQAGYDPF